MTISKISKVKAKHSKICLYCEIPMNKFENHQNANQILEDIFSCKFCDLVVKSQHCLESHQKIVHEIAEEVFTCDLCFIDFSRQKNLLLHTTIDHKNASINSPGKIASQDDISDPKKLGDDTDNLIDKNDGEDSTIKAFNETKKS